MLHLREGIGRMVFDISSDHSRENTLAANMINSVKLVLSLDNQIDGPFWNVCMYVCIFVCMYVYYYI